MNSLSTTKPNTSTSIWTRRSPEIDSTAVGAAAATHEIFAAIRAQGRQAVLLEGGEFSFVCVVDESVRVPDGEAGLLFMREFVRRNFRSRPAGSAPFVGGFVGFLSYDLGARWHGVTWSSQEIQNKASGGGHQNGLFKPKNRAKSLPGQTFCETPEAHFVYVDKVFAIRNEPYATIEKTTAGELVLQSNLTRQQYRQKIAHIKKLLLAGETYQVNFSQKFEAPYAGDAFELYKKISRINPSPFQFFMETPEFAVISNSPERMMKISACHPEFISGYSSRNKFGMTISTRPIKGTAPRGKTPEEDAENEKKLLASEKEKAELAMIVDLARNDLGKLCTPGSVAVSENRTVEKYSHVMHTVSNVRGVLLEQYDWYDALRALFPGGSVTGCPKKRTMEIITALEGEPRGLYCGSAGYIDLSGECDFNIMIRTLHFDKKSGTVTFRSGGGILIDSNPIKEYEETLHKAGAIMEQL